MLNIETKKIINSARDVLVGKVPDPKAQVEQITFAMFYKFMDEKDKESVGLGGKKQFFVGDFERYSWSKLMDLRLGGIDRMDLYTQALAKMYQNPHIAQLFRDIYKDAFIPFRSPETLNLFLKEIDQLDYSNTESLGDAFEYLLSVMGSQGDAGQFRTPRHIIDFIVEVVDPQKTDAILDPACGTAGFLISSYKHIIKAHDQKDDPENKEIPLTPDERKQLIKNLTGYDISPDMVRLSKVNMYLHGFPNPTIFEYDTLSDESKWDESFDVMLANPPFMSPKGGILPHKRFSIQANRSEVLFVDYILEHLKPSGRAGIIVPEGIIFQSANAYKALRKTLIEDGLYCVVSLPAGVFQPYSGVKTSILFFDKEIAKKVKHILFVKISSDGFDLGAQRRPVIYNDLPLVVEAINKYQKHVRANGKLSIGGWPEGGGENIDTYPNLLFVSKEEISKSGDYNLSGERYRTGEISTNQKWPLVELKTQTTFFIDGDWIESKDQSDAGIRLIQTGNVGIGEYIDKDIAKSRFISEQTFNRLHCKEIFAADVLISRLPDPVGRACIIPLSKNRMITSVDCTIVRFDEKKMLAKYFLYISEGERYFEEIYQFLTGSSRQRISRSNLAKVKIPAPTREIQEQIVAELDGYQKVIDGASGIVVNWKPDFQIDSDWAKVPIGELAVLVNGRGFGQREWVERNSDSLPIIRIQNLNGNLKDFNYFKGKFDEKILVHNGDLLFSWSGSKGTSFGPHIWQGENGLLNQHIFKVNFDVQKIDKLFFYFMLKIAVTEVEENLHGGVGLVHITKGDLEKINIPLPSMVVQKQIVEKVEAERALVESAKKLVEIYELKIKDKISKVWAP